MKKRHAAAILAAALLLAGCGGERPERSWSSLPDDAGIRMFAYVSEFVKTSPRDAGTPGAAKSSRWIAQELRRMGLRPEADCWTENTAHGRKTFCNVYVDFPGASGQTVLLAGHYDTKSGIPGFVGANDGGSSVGLLLGLAEHLAATRPELPDTVRIAFLDGEEAVGSYADTDGLHGSRRMAAQYAARRRRGARTPLVAALVFDMIGDEKLSLEIPRNVTPWLANAAMKAARETSGCPPVSLAANAILDDHVPFLMPPNEFAAIDFIDFEYGSAPGRHDYWHTAEDTLDKLSPRSLLRTGTFALALLRRIEEGNEVPPGIRPPPPQE
jgi:hypothetical protein